MRPVACCRGCRRRGEFDVILCSERLEHVDHPEHVVEHIHALSTPQTRVVVSVPIEAPKVRVKGLLQRIGLLDRLFPHIEPARASGTCMPSPARCCAR